MSIELVLEEGSTSYWTIREGDEMCIRMKKSAFTRASFQQAVQEKGSLEEILFFLAKRYAFRLLSKKSYHSNELLSKLLRVGFPEATGEQVIPSLRASGYIDDSAYCQRKVDSMTRSGKSPKEIAFRLKQKGVKTLSCQGDEDEAFRLCLNKKYPAWKTMITQPLLRAKLYRALLRRGFSLECVQKNLRFATPEEST